MNTHAAVQLNIFKGFNALSKSINIDGYHGNHVYSADVLSTLTSNYGTLDRFPGLVCWFCVSWRWRSNERNKTPRLIVEETRKTLPLEFGARNVLQWIMQIRFKNTAPPINSCGMTSAYFSKMLNHKTLLIWKQMSLEIELFIDLAQYSQCIDN